MNHLAHRLAGWVRPAVGALAVVLVLRAPPPAAAESTTGFGGTYAFRYILGEHALRLKPLDDFPDTAEAGKTLLIAFGDTDGLDAAGLREFVRHGGAVLIATDQRTSRGVAQAFGIGVTGQHVTDASPEPYHGSVDCPVVTRFNDQYPLFRRVSRVVTNVPSYIGLAFDAGHPGRFSDTPRLETVAWLPVVSPPGISDPPVREPNRRFAMAFQGSVARGRPESRILVVADQSVFIDGMMLQSDNDNFDFAYNCLEWLTASGQRDQVLFLEEGLPVTDFKVPVEWVLTGPPPSLADLPALPVEIADRVLYGLEEENVFNRLILGHVRRRDIWSGLAVALTLALVAFGFFRLLKARHRLDGAVPLFATGVRQLTPALGLVDQRQHAMFKEGNLWEAAHHLARECFEAVAPSAEPIAPTAAEPRITVAGNWWRRWVLQHQARRLWQLAHGSSSVRVSPREFSRLVTWARRVKAALADGTLRLDEPSRKP